MRNLLKISLLIIIAVLFSCEEQGFLVNCDNCIKKEPTEATLEMQIDRPNASGTTIRIYEGNLEDNILLATFIAFSENPTFEVPLNKKYTVTATGHLGGSYTAVDSATPKVKYVKDLCSDPCYYVYDKVLKLKIRYTR